MANEQWSGTVPEVFDGIWQVLPAKLFTTFRGELLTCADADCPEKAMANPNAEIKNRGQRLSAMLNLEYRNVSISYLAEYCDAGRPGGW